MGEPFKTHGAFSWVELMTTDPEAAKAFYVELFGWELEDSPCPGNEGMTYTVVKVAGQPAGGIMPMSPNVPPGVPPHWGCYVTVDDVDVTVAKVEELGGQILVPPTEIPSVGRFSVIQDPQGAVIQVIKCAERERDCSG